MEEPFSILPMEKMCEGSIRTPVMEQVERSQMVGVGNPTSVTPASMQAAAPVEAAPAPTIPAAATNGYSESDRAKIDQYFQDINSQWARQSGSQN